MNKKSVEREWHRKPRWEICRVPSVVRWRYPEAARERRRPALSWWMNSERNGRTRYQAQFKRKTAKTLINVLMCLYWGISVEAFDKHLTDGHRISGWQILLMSDSRHVTDRVFGFQIFDKKKRKAIHNYLMINLVEDINCQNQVNAPRILPSD